MRVFLLFLLGICAITFYFSLDLGKESFHYFRLKERAPARIAQWEIIPVNSRFALKADYTFSIQGKVWQDSFVLHPPYYLNETAALSALKAKAKKEWIAWYCPSHPQISALEKNFPIGLLIRTTVCFGVLIYFLILRQKIIANNNLLSSCK